MNDKANPLPADLDAIVSEVVVEGHVSPDQLRPEERAYLKEHALKKPLRGPDIWALGVGVVITGAYFGWNLGLKGNGPVAMLVASLLVCLLYLTWVLALAELSVAMPFAGGPLAYGRRGGDRCSASSWAGRCSWSASSPPSPPPSPPAATSPSCINPRRSRSDGPRRCRPGDGRHLLSAAMPGA